jgi:hypothetical protein
MGQGRKTDHLAFMREARPAVMAIKPHGAILSFDEYWAIGSPAWANAFAERVGAGEACRRRGLDGLLRSRPVRLAVGASMSQAYAQIEGRPKRGDDYDQRQAITASAVDVFVTKDVGFAKHVSRIPDTGLQVVTSLGELRALLK